MAEKKHLSHIKSKTFVSAGIKDRWLNGAVEIDGELKTPKLPTANDLVEGEIAINFAEGVETISHKNSEGNIVTYPNMGILEQDETILASALAEHETKINELQYKTSTSRSDLDNTISTLEDTEDDVARIEEVTAAAFAKVSGLDGRKITTNMSLYSLKEAIDKLIERVTALEEKINS